MRAVDPNVLVRLLVRDGAEQLAIAETFVEKGAWVSHLVLMEAVWVLDSVYDIPHDALAKGIEMLLDHAQLSIQDGDVVAAALASYRARPAVGFSDALILETARRSGHLPLGTFDRDFGKLDGTEHLR